MNYGKQSSHYVELSDNSRITISDWNDLVDVQVCDKKQGVWISASAVMLDAQSAKRVAIALLNMTGNSTVLAKKHRWAE